MSVNENKILRMKELIATLTEADVAYYRDDSPVMSDREYDKLTDELQKLESETGLVISGSPTQKVSGEVLEELTPVRHTKPMLSAKKTKSIEELVRFPGGRSVLVSWKLDGLTIVLRYENGELKQAITRGREGIVGEDVTHTVRTYLNVPLTIPIRDSIEIRGEGVISWKHFDLINSNLEEPYSHPRNLAAGSTRKLDANESRKRLLEFFAFDLISDHLERQSKLAQMRLMQNAGFSVVPFTYVDSTGGEELLRKTIDAFKPEHYGYPVDGLIVEYEDRAYGASLGATGHHENRMIALKWKDDPVLTKFLGVDLATTRTGMVSITGLFEPVSIDGALVSRAYLHNLDIFDAFQFGVGDEILVYKANQIIPQIAENNTKSGTFKMPMVCPKPPYPSSLVTAGSVTSVICTSWRNIGTSSCKLRASAKSPLSVCRHPLKRAAIAHWPNSLPVWESPWWVVMLVVIWTATSAAPGKPLSRPSRMVSISPSCRISVRP